MIHDAGLRTMHSKVEEGHNDRVGEWRRVAIEPLVRGKCHAISVYLRYLDEGGQTDERMDCMTFVSIKLMAGNA